MDMAFRQFRQSNIEQSMRIREEHPELNKYRLQKSVVEERIGVVLARIEPQSLRKAVEYGAYGGKMIRPIVTMLSCAAVGGKGSAAVDAATAIELLHTSSLIHDDIMDASPLRRGRPTVHTAFDTPLAILAGDTFVALAFQLMQNIHSPNKERINELFANAFRHVCEGQGFDLCLTHHDCAEHGVHKKMVEKKTARLLEAAAAIGALIGTINEDHVEALGTFGYNLGMAFQAKDDLLDAIGNEQMMGKPVSIDAKNGRNTYLTVANQAAASDDFAGVVSTAASLVDEYTNAACSSLELLPPTEGRELLTLLAESLTKREA